MIRDTSALDPQTRAALYIQQLKEAKAAQQQKPPQGQIVGDRYIYPVAEWTGQFLDGIQGRLHEKEALAALSTLAQDKKTALTNFTKQFEGKDLTAAENKPQLFNALFEAIGNPYLSDTDVPKILGTLAKPSSSLFSDLIASNGYIVPKSNPEAAQPIPPIVAADKEKQKALDARSKADDDRAERRLAWEQQEAKRKAELHDKEMQLKQEQLAQAQADAMAKHQDELYNKYMTMTKDFAPVYESARQMQDIFKKYPKGDIPGFGTWANIRGALGQLTEEEARNVATFNKLREYFQTSVTGAAAPDEQSQRLANILGQQSRVWDNAEKMRAVFPDIEKLLDTQNKYYRTTLGPTPKEQDDVLMRKGNPLANYLAPQPTTTWVDPNMSPENRRALEQSGELQGVPTTGPVEVHSREEVEKLPSGTKFIYNGRKMVRK